MDSENSSGVEVQEKSWYLANMLQIKLKNMFTRLNLSRESKDFRNLTVSQLRILSCIVTKQDLKIKIKDIAKELSITPGGISQLVNSLQKMDLLKRIPDEHDRRIVYVTFSEHGFAMYHAALDIQEQLTTALTQEISEEEMKVFTNVLKKMLGRLDCVEKMFRSGEISTEYLRNNTRKITGEKDIKGNRVEIK